MESERSTLRLEQQQHEEKVRLFEEEKQKFEREKEETQKSRLESEQRIFDENSNLQRKTNELQEREMELNQRENALNSAVREFQNRQLSSAYMQSGEYGYNNAFNPYPQNQQNQGYGYYSPYGQQNVQTDGYYGNLRERAQADGIKLNTAGSMSPKESYSSVDGGQKGYKSPINAGTYPIGQTLYKAAFIIFCIILFESLTVFFLKYFLNVSYVYPIVGFVGGFALFITCAILHACNYRPNARRKKHPTYILTATVIFVIAVIIVTMIAVYCKAQMSIPSQLFSYVVIPVIYLLNIIFFVAFYHLFSKKAVKENR